MKTTRERERESEREHNRSREGEARGATEMKKERSRDEEESEGERSERDRDEDLGLRREGRRLGLRRGSQTARSKSSNRGSKPTTRFSPCPLKSASFSHQIRVSLFSDSQFC